MAVTATLTLGCCLWLLGADLTAFDDIEVVIPVGLALVLPVLAWLALALVGHMKYTGWRRLGLLVPIFIAATVALTWAEVPGRIGWVMSRGALDRAAAACEPFETSSSGTSYNGKRIGVYEFHRIERKHNGECNFRLLRDYPGVRSGFVYIPNGERPDGIRAHTYYEPLGGPWYYYRWIG
jgi:hypothetical protein